jgi:hypothetical protein
MRIATLVLLLAVVCTQFGCSFVFAEKIERRARDEGFVMLRNELSPNGFHRLLIYQYDTGAFGYSRVWWAVTPENYSELDLVVYELPDGYLAKGWTMNGRLQISKWRPYYFTEGEKETVSIQSGDSFRGVTVELVENETTDALGRE